jgi:endonuclease/exonuclease/phosphatase family protein
MALSRKRGHLYKLSPDIAVIPECGRKCISLCVKEDGFDGRWIGINPRKGLGILVAKPWRITRVARPQNKWIVPVWLTDGPHRTLLLAVWAMPVNGSTTRSYIGQVYEALVRNRQWFRRDQVIIAGDFNSNCFWDAERVRGNHSSVVKLLTKRRLVSSYHLFFSENQGEETRPTYYFWHRKNRGYHIDYVFFPARWAAHLNSVEVGTHARWSKLSDHVPLTVDVGRLNSTRQSGNHPGSSRGSLIKERHPQSIVSPIKIY